MTIQRNELDPVNARLGAAERVSLAGLDVRRRDGSGRTVAHPSAHLIGELLAKHWQAAARRSACSLVLDDIPVLRESPVLDTDDIEDDPGCWLTHVGETPVQHQQVALGHDQTVLVSHRSWGALDQIE